MIHGGNIFYYANKIKCHPKEILDFSANINPLDIPDEIIKKIKENINNLSFYPDPDYSELKNKIALYHQISSGFIVCGNGASELIFALSRVIKNKNILIPVPTFLEYTRHFEKNNNLIKYQLKERNFKIEADFAEHINKDIHAVIICNPNNPTSNLIQKEYLIKIFEKCKKYNTMLIIDECFLDFCPDAYSFVNNINDEVSIVIIKSFTKMFSIPGLRLGYLITNNQSVLQNIKENIPEWNVNALAEKAGIAITEDYQHILKSVKYINEQKKELSQELNEMKFNILGQDANFIFFSSTNKINEEKLMKKHKILIRNCENFSLCDNYYYRIAIKKKQDNIKLINAFKKIHCGE